MSGPHAIAARDWVLLLILSVLWGGSFLFVGIAVKELPPLVIVFARVTLAAAALLPLHLLRLGPLPATPRVWVGLIGMAILNNVLPFTLIATGQTMLASGLASVINATAPLFGALFLAAAGDEPLVARKIAALLLGLCGVAILKGTDMSQFSGQSLGIVYCLAAAACYGLSSLWVKRRLRGVPPLTLATGQLLSSTAIMAVLVFTLSEPETLLAASVRSWAALLALALFATALAYLIFFRIVERAGPANVLLVTMLIPVSAILFGHFFLGEKLALREIAGGLVIGASLVIFDGRVLSRLSHDTA